MKTCAPFDPTMAGPGWLVILRDHGYDLDRIADPVTRRNVARALQQNGIELLRGNRRTYSTRDMQTG
jgi:hypothetical protein